MPAITEQLDALSRALDSAQSGDRDVLGRIVAELGFASKLRDLHSDSADQWTGLIEQAAGQVGAALEGGGDLRAAVSAAEDILAPVGEVAKTYTIHNAGHGHIDMNWMWSWPETVSVTVDTFTTVLRLMDAYDDFCYSQSQASVYDLLRLHDPDLLARIRERVDEGRWEITASHWVEADKNVSGGESFCRHLLYTRAFMKEHFDLDPEDITIDWEPDTFGHAHTIPSFLAGGGVKRYYHCRSGIGSNRPPVFWWQGPDGSRVLVYKEISGSWYNGLVEPATVDSMISFCKTTGLRTWLNVYGVGDHGGGPTRADIERCHDMDTWPVYPNWVLSTTKPFYELLEENGDKWPVLDHELNFEFQGCYTTQTTIKKANRFSENRLYQAEAAATLANAVTGMTYPGERLREGWINTLFSQFHDILPGSGVRDTREYCMGQFQETMARSGSISTRALRQIAAQIDTVAVAGEPDALPGPASGSGAGFDSELGGISHLDGQADAARPFVVFNLSGTKRSGIVEATIWDAPWDAGRIVVKDDAGNTCAAQKVKDGHYWGHTFITVVFPAQDIPAMGRRTYVLQEGSAAVANPLQHSGRGIVENEHVRVEIDWNTGGIKSLVDKASGAELADPTNPMGVFEFAIERDHGMTSWVIGDIMSSDALREVEKLDVQAGPYQTAFVSTIKVADSTIKCETIVRAGDPTVELYIAVNWLERGYPARGVPMLRLHVPTALSDVTPTYEIPYGTVTREEKSGEEVPSQRFCDLTGKASGGIVGKNAGLLIVNDSKYGFALTDASLSATLIRSSYDPDPLPEIGDHVIRIGLRPHAGDLAARDMIADGVAFNQPLAVIATDAHTGSLAPSGTWLDIAQANVALAAVKQAESGDGIVLRFYETDGSDVEATVDLADALSGTSATQVDLLEAPVEDSTASISGGKLSVEIPAHGIVSVLVK